MACATCAIGSACAGPATAAEPATATASATAVAAPSRHELLLLLLLLRSAAGNCVLLLLIMLERLLGQVTGEGWFVRFCMKTTSGAVFEQAAMARFLRSKATSKQHATSNK
jgi:hypothetical protein